MVAAVIGALLVITAAGSVIGTIIVPRPIGSWLTRLVDQLVSGAFRLVMLKIHDYHRRDRVLAAQAATILLAQLIAWLAIFFIGYTLLLWPLIPHGITRAFTTAGPALWEIGSVDDINGAGTRAILDMASLSGIITITLQIAYLPTLYAAFNRRETEVTLLNARSGVPSWGPELLSRTHYALGSGTSTVNTLPELYQTWERFAADIAESHTTYLPLVRFRSPRKYSSWVISLLSVLDSAALYLAFAPKAAPTVPARLCLRSGFECLNGIAQAMNLKVEPASLDSGISLRYKDFLDGLATMQKVNFPIEREPEEAWPEFVGWRINYEAAAYAVAEALEAVPALWSGPRHPQQKPIPPIRPPAGRPPR